MMSGDIPVKNSPQEESSGHRRVGVFNLVRHHRALPAFVGAFAVWIATALIAGHGIGGTLTTGMAIGTFLLIVGIGQMFVITSGNGGIDLSVPWVMTLSAYLSAMVMVGRDSNLLLGLAVAILVGLAAGTLNLALIEVFAMPPIVATLALGLVLESWCLVLSNGTNVSPSPLLVSFTTGWLGPIPLLAIFGVVLMVIFTIFLNRSSYGRSLKAVGQSQMAARLSGVRRLRVTAIAYLTCAVSAAIAGFLLVGYAGGPSLTLGLTYQLASIAVVVLGGSLIAGGMSNVPGIWAAALLLTLLVTMVNVTHLGPGMQDILQGALIVIVLAIGGHRRVRA